MQEWTTKERSFRRTGFTIHTKRHYRIIDENPPILLTVALAAEYRDNPFSAFMAHGLKHRSTPGAIPLEVENTISGAFANLRRDRTRLLSRRFAGVS